jgi:hypothetical protein
LPQSSSRPPMTEGAAQAIARSSNSFAQSPKQSELSRKFRKPTSRDDCDGPSVTVGLVRVGTFFAIVAIASYFVWEIFSESAALSRLNATAEIFTYPNRCAADGTPIETGQPNCVDLGRYVFIHGPVNIVIHRACSGTPARVLTFEPGQVSRREIHSAWKGLQAYPRSRTKSPC